MTQNEYENKKRECWDALRNELLKDEVQWQPVSRKEIDALQGEIFKAVIDAHDADDWQDAAHYILDVMPRSFAALFGSKCLPDNVDSSEPNVDSLHDNVDSLPQNPTENCDNKSHISADCNKPAEPKFKIGDKVRYRPSGEVYEVEGKTGRQHYALKGWLTDIVESDLEPYTEPTENLKPSNSGELESQQTCTQFDNIVKGGFLKERRLNIAAMAMQGILCNKEIFNKALQAGEETLAGDDISYRAVAKASFAFADALIAEAKLPIN